MCAGVIYVVGKDLLFLFLR